MSDRNEFKPDWVSPPGDTILEILEERKISLSELMDRLEIPIYDVFYLIKGKISITEEIARKLVKFLGGSKQFWMNREAQYRESLERK